MRTFIAIPLPKECRATLDRMQQGLRRCQADVRWVAIPSIHLTLKFLGEVDPGVLQGMHTLLSDCAKPECSFELRLHGLGCFPNPIHPRVVWCGIGGETDALARLQRIVESACASMGFAPEDRLFRPHLTLGRIRGRRNMQALAEKLTSGSDLACGFRVDRFHIYESSLKPQGAVYTVLNTVVLNEC